MAIYKYLKSEVEELAFINGNYLKMKQMHIIIQATAMLVYVPASCPVLLL
jgi:hypothetical protein